MIIKKCDRCGVTIEDPKKSLGDLIADIFNNYDSNKTEYIIQRETTGNITETIDLCEGAN